MRVIGLMSGTSLDGMDAALVDLDDRGERLEWSLVHFRARPFPADRREEIHEAILHGDAGALCHLHAALGEWFAGAALELLEEAGVAPAQVDLIGSHGQTVWHRPPVAGERGATLQLGCPATIAERTGIPVVSDFRSRDMAAGGEGAPLVPWVDRLLFAAEGRTRILQNIGGMANLTRVPPIGSDEGLLAFDTGPGNALIDMAVELATGGRQHYDDRGEWASRGAVDEALVDELLEEPFFRRAPPRSTGRETFGRALVERLVARRAPASVADWADLIAALTSLTARSIADAVHRWVVPRGADEFIVTGGGARNVALMGMLRERLAPLPMTDARSLNIDPAAKEAIAFATLAWAHVRRHPANVPDVTGAAGPRVLGSYTPGNAPL